MYPLFDSPARRMGCLILKSSVIGVVMTDMLLGEMSCAEWGMGSKSLSVHHERHTGCAKYYILLVPATFDCFPRACDTTYGGARSVQR